MDDFLQKFVRIVLYGWAIGQSDRRKTGPYQLPYKNDQYSASKMTGRTF